ncbi:MAG TPA: SdrD B-like domain-containing protein [Tepidisphaeraceae bacterium]|jgi:probable HAF family extracellular repeat protein
MFENLEGRRLFAVAYTITDLAPDTGGVAHTGKAYGISDNGKVAMQYDGNAAFWSAGVVTDLGFDGFATDINNNGVVVGVDTSSGQNRPFVWKSGVKTNLTLNGVTNGVASAINNDGTVVGTFFNLGVNNDGFAKTLNGPVTDVGAPAGYESVSVTGINEDGQIIGNVVNVQTGTRAFIKSGGTFKLLGPLPGGPTTRTDKGITDSGTIAISGPSADVYDGNTKIYHAYTVGSNGYGAITDRGTYGSFYDVEASDINNSGVITGNNNPGLNDSQGMINGGSGFDLVENLISPAAGWTRIFSAEALNHSGKVVGEGFNALGQRSPYLLTPIPTTHQISGTLWNDTDKDGVFDANESPTGARTVYIDANTNGKLDNGEKQTTSNDLGQYTFTGLADGTYQVRRIFPSGFGMTNPTNGGSYRSVVLNGANVSGVHIGTAAVTLLKGSIRGTLFNDSAKDGFYNGNEMPSGVRQVFIDSNANKKLDPGEKSTFSDINGRYLLQDLVAGTYKVTRVFPSGYKLSNNALGYVSVTLSPGQDQTGVNLGTRTV